MVKYTCIIIDDEEQAINALLLELKLHCPEITVVDCCANVEQAVKSIDALSPDMLFLDIRLTDGTGFDVLREIQNKQIKVVFTTAYSEFAIQAFKFNAIDYLLKPINGVDLAQTTRKIILTENNDLKNRISNLLSNQTTEKREQKIAIQSSDGIHLFPVMDFLHLNSERNYTRIFLSNGKTLLSAKTLKEFDEMLSDEYFLRVHQSHIVNLAHVESYINRDGGYLTIQKTSIPVSTRKKNEVLKVLKGRYR